MINTYAALAILIAKLASSIPIIARAVSLLSPSFTATSAAAKTGLIYSYQMALVYAKIALRQ